MEMKGNAENWEKHRTIKKKNKFWCKNHKFLPELLFFYLKFDLKLYFSLMNEPTYQKYNF